MLDRSVVKERYEALRMLIPNPGKVDKASIVKDGINYINELRILISELKNLVEKNKIGVRHKNNNEVDKNMEKKPESDVKSNNSLRKSKVTEVYVRIVDDEVTIKVAYKKKINCLLFVCEVLDQFQLELYYVDGRQIGEHYSFFLKTKISEGSTKNANAIANKVIEVVDEQCMAPLPVNN